MLQHLSVYRTSLQGTSDSDASDRPKQGQDNTHALHRAALARYSPIQTQSFFLKACFYEQKHIHLYTCIHELMRGLYFCSGIEVEEQRRLPLITAPHSSFSVLS